MLTSALHVEVENINVIIPKSIPPRISCFRITGKEMDEIDPARRKKSNKCFQMKGILQPFG